MSDDDEDVFEHECMTDNEESGSQSSSRFIAVLDSTSSSCSAPGRDKCIKKIPKDVVLADCQRVASEVKMSCVRCARVLPGDRPRGAKGIGKQQAYEKALSACEEELEEVRQENQELKTKLDAIVRSPSVSLKKIKI